MKVRGLGGNEGDEDAGTEAGGGVSCERAGIVCGVWEDTGAGVAPEEDTPMCIGVNCNDVGVRAEEDYPLVEVERGVFVFRDMLEDSDEGTEVSRDDVGESRADVMERSRCGSNEDSDDDTEFGSRVEGKPEELALHAHESCYERTAQSRDHVNEAHELCYGRTAQSHDPVNRHDIGESSLQHPDNPQDHELSSAHRHYIEELSLHHPEDHHSHEASSPHPPPQEVHAALPSTEEEEDPWGYPMSPKLDVPSKDEKVESIVDERHGAHKHGLNSTKNETVYQIKGWATSGDQDWSQSVGDGLCHASSPHVPGVYSSKQHEGGCVYRAGDAVRGRYVDGYFYNAVVAEVREDGMIVLDWDDGDEVDRVKKACDVKARMRDARASERILCKTLGVREEQQGRVYRVGDAVRGRYLDGYFYDAFVAEVWKDGRIVLDWADGDEVDRVKKACDVKARRPGARGAHRACVEQEDANNGSDASSHTTVNSEAACMPRCVERDQHDRSRDSLDASELATPKRKRRARTNSNTSCAQRESAGSGNDGCRSLTGQCAMAQTHALNRTAGCDDGSCARSRPYQAIMWEDKQRYLSFDVASVPSSSKTTQDYTQDYLLLSCGGKSNVASRGARLEKRMTAQKVSETVMSDAFKFNVLDARGKKLSLRKSAVHGWGLFADEWIDAGEMVIEYRGELISNKVCEKRERAYARSGIGSSYMFRIDKNNVIDATRAGNRARYVNHSCDPNCYTQIINVSGKPLVVLYSKRCLDIGEELCYDYNFPFENGGVPCRCGALKCRGYMA